MSDMTARSESESRHPAVIARNRLLVLLTLSSGAVDAICYLGLGKVFSAFMTGNFVFLGLRFAGAPGPHLASVVIALCAFVAGVFAASRIVSPAQRSDVWPRRVTQALAGSVAGHAAFVVLWLIVGGSPSQTEANVLLGISALAMGTQTAAVFALGVHGVFTTAATATFTVLSGDTAHWANSKPERHRLAALLIALVGGALAGGLLVEHARDVAPLLPLAVSTLVVLAAALRFPPSRRGTEEPPAGHVRLAA